MRGRFEGEVGGDFDEGLNYLFFCIEEIPKIVVKMPDIIEKNNKDNVIHPPPSPHRPRVLRQFKKKKEL